MTSETTSTDESCAVCGRADALQTPTPPNTPNLVCSRCDKLAVTEDGSRPDTSRGSADTQVYVKGHKCFRRFKFGGYVTLRDAHDCDTITEFFEKNDGTEFTDVERQSDEQVKTDEAEALEQRTQAFDAAREKMS